MKATRPSLRFTALMVFLTLSAAAPPREASATIFMPWWILTQPGCADLRKSGECFEIDYVPRGDAATTPGNFSDERLPALIAACNPAVIGWKWLDLDEPSLPEHCEDLILEDLPLSSELEFPSTSDQRMTREALARALYAMLFVPLADPGGFFGSTDSADYCPSIYRDFLGAEPRPVDEIQVLSAASYEAGTAPLGTHLVRFILERTERFQFSADDEEEWITVYASESGEKITLFPGFGMEKSPLTLASLLVHESRHTVEGFPDGSSHTLCSLGEGYEESRSCDRTNFGAYGSAIAYLDAAIRGGIRALTSGRRPLFSLELLQDAYWQACDRYLYRIEERSDFLTAEFGRHNCLPDEGELVSELALLYGMDESQVLIRGRRGRVNQQSTGLRRLSTGFPSGSR